MNRLEKNLQMQLPSVLNSGAWRFSFARRITPLKSDIVVEDNKNVSNSEADKIVKDISLPLKAIFNKTNKAHVEVVEMHYPGFFKILQKADEAEGIEFDDERRRYLMDQSERVYGIIDPTTNTIYINKDLILKSNPNDPLLQKAFFTLTVIHEVLHQFGEIPDFTVQDSEGITHNINAEFLTDGIVEMLARNLMKEYSPDLYRKCRMAEAMSTGEKIYRDYLHIARTIENLLDSKILPESLFNSTSSELLDNLFSINKEATIELCKAGSDFCNETAEGEPSENKLQELRGKIKDALDKLKEARHSVRAMTEGELDKLLKTKRLRSDEKFDDESIKSRDDLVAHVLELFPSSKPFQQYMLGTTASRITFIENPGIQTVNESQIAKTIDIYCRLFEHEYGITPPDIDMLYEYMSKKKISHYSGANLKELESYRKIAYEMLGERADKRYFYLDAVWLSEKIGITGGNANAEKTIQSFSVAALFLESKNVHSPSVADIAAMVMSLCSIEGEMRRVNIDSVFDSINSKLKSINGIIFENNEIDNIDAYLKNTQDYVKSINKSASETEARHLLELVSFWNSYATADQRYIIHSQNGATRIDQNWIQLSPIETNLWDLTDNDGRIATNWCLK